MDSEDRLKELIVEKAKISRFYKEHVDELLGPLFIIIKMMQRSDYFPRLYRTSKATFLSDRTIFSLETLENHFY